MGRANKSRKEQLLKCVPAVFDYKTLLYIGAKKRRRQMLNLFVAASYEIDIIEIWSPNVVGLRDLQGIRRIIKGDIRDVLGMNLTPYDVIMWWHGPEHVRKKELYGVLGNLEKLSKKLIVTACPWGFSPLRASKKNIHDTHLSYLYPNFFEGLGWEINMIGNKNSAGSNLLAWKEV